jgi:Spy/CpxP family protein refolding chaperone
MKGKTTGRTAIAAAALGLLLAGSAAAAQGFRAGREGAPGGGLRAALATLDLSDAQKEKVRQLLESERPKYEGLRQEGRAARQALRAAAESPNADPAAVGAAFLKVRAHAKTMKVEREASKVKIEALLTPEQRGRLEGWLEAHRQMRRGPGAGMGRQGRPGPPPSAG